MSATIQTTQPGRSSTQALAENTLVDLTVAADAGAGMASVVETITRELGVAGVEWWAATDGGPALALEAAAGIDEGEATSYPLGSAGELLVYGTPSGTIASAVRTLAPVLRRRLAEEQLFVRMSELVRRNEALEDFAALVAHELKGPLLEIAHGGDPTALARDALDLVDSILETARAGGSRAGTPVSSCLDAVVRELPRSAAAVECSSDDEAPMTPGALSILLRNLVKNAVAAGARSIVVGSGRTAHAWTLTVDDDGAGVGSHDYASGSGVGLGLCRRLVERLGGTLELESRRGGGTRARLVIAGGLP
ncbi:MAG: HAMP domain-containing histidine kinase [Actinobacteria bacterium]|nr:HAMP domain-containing histidine kinase [Actinomycetota bacterium]